MDLPHRTSQEDLPWWPPWREKQQQTTPQQCPRRQHCSITQYIHVRNRHSQQKSAETIIRQSRSGDARLPSNLYLPTLTTQKHIHHPSQALVCPHKDILGVGSSTRPRFPTRPPSTNNHVPLSLISTSTCFFGLFHSLVNLSLFWSSTSDDHADVSAWSHRNQGWATSLDSLDSESSLHLVNMLVDSKYV